MTHNRSLGRIKWETRTDDGDLTREYDAVKRVLRGRGLRAH